MKRKINNRVRNSKKRWWWQLPQRGCIFWTATQPTNYVAKPAESVLPTFHRYLPQAAGQGMERVVLVVLIVKTKFSIVDPSGIFWVCAPTSRWYLINFNLRLVFPLSPSPPPPPKKNHLGSPTQILLKIICTNSILHPAGSLNWVCSCFSKLNC